MSDQTGDREVVAFDVGGTHLRSARLGPSGRLQDLRERPTPCGDVDQLLAALVEEARHHAAAAGRPPLALGLAIAGFSDTRSGIVFMSPGLGLRDAELGGPLSRATGVPVRLVNDVNAAAWAEARTRGADDLVAIFVGTGVGTGLVSGGRLVEGHRGAALEGGHVLFREGGAPYPTVDGCFEAYLGGRALAARAAELLGEELTTAAVIERWRSGDTRLDGVIGDARAAMVALTRLLVTLGDPRVVVLGGGVVAGWPELLQDARGAVDPRPLAPGLGAIEVQPARCGDDAGLLGAGLLAAVLAGAG